MANDNQFIQEDVLFPQAKKESAPVQNNGAQDIGFEEFDGDIGAEVLFTRAPAIQSGELEELSFDDDIGQVEELFVENDEVGEEALFTGKAVVEDLSPLEELAPVQEDLGVDEEVLFKTKEEPVTISQQVESAPSIVSEELAALSEDDGELNVASSNKPVYIEKNFAQKFLEADELILQRYDELKNCILRYKNVKSRVSNDFDSFNMGRTQLFKLGFSTQSLKLYLNLDFATVESRLKCKDVSHKKAYAQVPVFLRIKSPRAMRNAKYLIDKVVERFNLKENPKATKVDSIKILKERAKTYN